MEYSEESFNRLSIGLIDRNGYSPEEALNELKTYRLGLHAGETIKTSIALQAALLTAVNSGFRAFLGGVFVVIPPDTKCHLPWANTDSLNQIVEDLGGRIVASIPNDVFTLTFGLPSNIENNCAQVVASGWKGGVFSNGESPFVVQENTLSTGGVYAGGLSVCLAFLRISGIEPEALEQSVGMSLWRPDLNWLAEDAEGPISVVLPSEFWLLGLGHLGQAYVWNIGLLPFKDTKSVEVLLHDYDRIVPANMSAGLISNLKDTGRKKTRVCAEWLEARGINTTIVERKFNEHTKREEFEPGIALGGFDNAMSRSLLENAGFEFIVEAGLGDNWNNFDKIILHTFPSGLHNATNLWNKEPTDIKPNERVLSVLTNGRKKECGILELTIAGKAVSASFVGACAGALVLAEIIKAFNQGEAIATLANQLRYTKYIEPVSEGKTYTVELARCKRQKSKAHQLV